MKPADRAADQNDRRYRNALRAGLAISVALHVALFLGWRTDAPVDGASVAAGPRSGDPVAAAGGGAMRALALAEMRPIEIPSPPEPIPTLDAPDIAASVPRERLSTGVSLSRPGGQGAGLTGATGRGDGGTDAEGRYRNTVPEPRVIIPDWDAPADVKGMQVRLRVLVDEQGRAVDVELDPRTPDEKFNRRLIESAMAMEFKPALRNGRPVRDWAVITRVF